MIKSSTYSLGTKAIETILNLSLLAILARLLEPKDFGIFAIVLAVQALLQPLVDMGLTPAYIKAQNPTVVLQNSFFTLNLMLGIFNVLILLILAPIVSMIYENNILLYLITIFSISVIFNSISRQGYAQLTRDKRFDKLMMVSLVANVITFAISVYFAYAEYGVWVLIIKAISLNIVSAFMIHYFVKSKYKVASWNTIKQFTVELKFGFEIFINRVLNGVFNASDKFIFGKLFGTELLGHYSNSQQIARMADTHIRMPITSAIYSHLERYGDGDKKDFYDKFASIVFLVTSLFTGLLILEGDVLLVYFLGEKWTFATEYIQPLGLFAIGMVFKGIYTIISMSENNMRVQNKRVLGSLALLFFLLALTYYLSFSAYLFIIIFSITFILYWGTFLTKELKRLNAVNNFIKSITFLLITVLVLSGIKYTINQPLIELAIVLVSYISIVIGILYFNYYKNRRKI